MIAKVGIFAVIAGGLFWVFNQFSGQGGNLQDAIETVSEVIVEKEQAQLSEDFLPTSSSGEVIHHKYYSLSYSEKHEQAEWVAYELTRENLMTPNVERTGNFRPDPRVRKASASTRDYSGSGYDRGHLAPAGDMAFSRESMSESFYMSNMSPQIRNFNGGAWRELEESVRDWADEFGHLYVITGPVLTRGIRETIGDNEVSVPDEYFKVILDAKSTPARAIAYLMPNEIIKLPLQDYALSVDEVEEITGIDFFHNLFPDETEEQIESIYRVKEWPLEEKRFKKRLDKWNRRK